MARGRSQPKKSSNSNKKKSSAPPQAEQINYGQLIAQASEAARGQTRDAIAASIEAYPQQEALQLGTIQKVADNLRATEYTQRATDQLTAAGAIPAALGTLADRTGALAEAAQADLPGTDIERELGAAALRELQLGRALTPEQEREAQQAARAGLAARGLGLGTGALAAEVLNRDRVATAREAERRNFAGQTNQLLTGNRQARLGLASDLLGQTGNIRMSQAGLGQNLAASNIAADPYMRAFAPGTSIGGGTLSTGANMVGNIYNSATQMAGNVASFNANMIDSRRNAFFNNRTALESARIAGGAAQNAGTMGMIGSIAGSALIGAAMLSDRREKTDIKPIGKAAGVLGLTAYEYKYKGDDKKRLGLMAQEVREVLPEAVEEITVKGKPRLAIKPAILGQAFAKQLTA